ncbi:MAG: hypothetical protein R2818_02660 [Flavobacteriales bacterium]
MRVTTTSAPAGTVMVHATLALLPGPAVNACELFTNWKAALTSLLSCIEQA